MRESAKRRKTTWALAATLALLCVVASGVGFWRYRDEAQRQRESDRALTTAFHSATEAWNNARLAAPYEDDDDILLWNEALKAIRLAESRIRAESDPELVARIKTTLQDLQYRKDTCARMSSRQM